MNFGDMIDIKDRSGKIIFSTGINKGAKGKFTLMKEDYIILPFSVPEPVPFKLGDYVDLSGVLDESLGGKMAKIYEITDIQKPTYNTSTGGYDYELQMNAYYWKWKNKIFKYTPEHAASEASWSLTAALDVQLGVFLRNLKALGYTYRGEDFTFSIDDTVENKALAMTYDNMNLLDALFSMAGEDKWNCDCWITDNVIHFGRNEFGDAVKIERGVEASSITRSESQGTYATRIYAFGSTKNIPTNYRPTDEQAVVNGVVQKRLMLPTDTPYIDAYEGMSQEEAIEDVVVFDDVYPRRVGTLSDVHTRTEEVENGTKETVTYYRYKDIGLDFKEEYILEGEELKIQFQSGKLNGMEFGVIFNPKPKDDTRGEQLWEIVRNEDYGRPLPDETIRPENGDEYVLSGFNIQLVSDQYIQIAEQELKEKAQKYADKVKKDDGTYPTTLRSSWVKEDLVSRTFEFGQRVNLVDDTFFENGRISRVLGWEMNLDIPWDSPVYTIGESMSYSRIGEIEDKVDSLTYKGQTYNGNGSGVYIIRVNDNTPASDSNVFSAMRALKMFLRKDKSDSTSYLQKFLGGIDIGKFSSLISGGTFRIDADGKSYIEVDKLLVRMKAVFEELQIKKVSHIGGEQYVTPASMEVRRVEEGDTYYRCYATDDDSTSYEMEFSVGDQALSKMVDLSTSETGVINRYYWRLVVGVGKNYIDLSKSDADEGSDAPNMGDTIVSLGNRTDKDRQNAIIISSVSVDAPSIKMLQSIDSYDLEGKDVMSQGFDTTTNRAFLNILGDFFAGDIDESTYVRYDAESKELSIRGKLITRGGTEVDSALSDLNDQINGYEYLKKAFENNTTIQGGVVSTSVVYTGYTGENGKFTPMSGINGIYLEDELKGHGISYWAGGKPIDKESYTDVGSIPTDAAKALIRMDGSGYFANGNLSWDKNGILHADPLSFFVGEDKVGDILKLFVPIYDDADGETVIGISARYPIVVQGGVTVYQGTPISLPSIFEGLLLDPNTLGWNEKGQLSVIGGVGASNWDELEGKPSWITDTKPTYTWDEITSKPDWIKESKPTYVWSEILSKPDTLSGYGIKDAYTKTQSDSLYPTKAGVGASGTWGIGITGNAGSATKLQTARTLWGQSFDGTKNVSGSLTSVTDITGTGTFTGANLKATDSVYINGIRLYKSADGVIMLDGNLAVKGGVTTYATDEVTASTIMDGVAVDGTTITKVDGVLKVLNAGGGEAGSVAWDNITGKPIWIGASKPSYNWSEITSKPTTFTPSSHTHNYVSTVKVGGTSYNVVSNVVSLPAYPVIPSALKNPNALTISLNGTSQGAYDGSAAKSINITASSVGAAAASHNHSWSNITSGKPTTLSGYGITDAYTKAQSDSLYPTKAGAGASGTWGIGITGNAGSATKLQTARTLWGQSFDGTNNVTGSLTSVTDITGTGTFIGANLKATDSVYINGIRLYKSADGVIMLDGNLAVKGGVTTYATDEVSASTIMDGVAVDGTTIAKVDGVLKVLNAGGGEAGSVAWDNITGKPSTFPPSSHTHNYVSTVKVGSTSYNVVSNVVSLPAYPTIPSALKNPNALTISLNGTSQGAYDGSAAKSINITASSVGAAASSHNHSWSNITSGKPTTLSGYGITDAYTKTDSDNRFVNVSGDTMTENLCIQRSGRADKIELFQSTSLNQGGITLYSTKGNFALRLTDTDVTWKDNKIWHAGNDGSGSGLDADLLDGKHYTDIINGNVASATKLQTARQINGTNFDGSSNITTAKWGNARTLTIGQDSTGSVSMDGSANVTLNIRNKYIVGDRSEQVAISGIRNAAAYSGGTGFSSWAFGVTRNTNRAYISLIKAGSTALGLSAHGTILCVGSGDTHMFIGCEYGAANLRVGGGNADKIVWQKQIAFTDGNVASATKLQTARTIWGQSFNGTGNVSGNMSGVGDISSYGQISALYQSGTWIRSLKNAVVNCNLQKTGYGGWINGTTKNGRIVISSFPANDDNLYFGYAEQSKIDAGTDNSFTHQMYWTGSTGQLSVIGDILSKGCLRINPTAGNYCEGIRIKPYNNVSRILLGGSDLTADTGTSTNSWEIGNRSGSFAIMQGNDGLACYKGNWTIGANLYPVVKLGVGGDILAMGGVTLYSSDARAKDIIGKVDLSIKEISKSPTIRFRWNGWKIKDDGKVHIGGVAQYVQKILPEAILDAGGFLNLDYATTAYIYSVQTARYLVKTDTEVERLKKRVRKLELKLKKLGYEEIDNLAD